MSVYGNIICRFFMPRSKRDWTEEKRDRYMKEGRGQGSGRDYKPWIEVSDFSSSGRVSRDLGWKTNRVHYLMSDGETRLYYLFEWSDRILDIREQFPLLDRELCFKITEDMGVEYPKDPKSGAPYVLTTDFMLTVTRDGSRTDEARTFKPSKSLNDKRTALKLEIERRYYTSKGVNWKIVTEKDLPKLTIKNIEWIHSAYRLEENQGMNRDDLYDLSATLKSRLETVSSSVSKITKDLDLEMNVDAGTSLYLFRHLLANKLVLVNMSSQKALTSLSTESLKFRKADI
jgi:TnsA endonuclease N terminal/TnsA endonuclease C terminal